MWYEGTYSCGHKGQVQLYGKKKEREWRAQKIFEGICEDCKEKLAFTIFSGGKVHGFNRGMIAV